MITLDVLHGMAREAGCGEVLVATGSNNARDRLTRQSQQGQANAVWHCAPTR